MSTPVYRSSSQLAALFCLALLGAGCGLTDALGNGSTPRIPLTLGDGGVDPGDAGDAGTPDPDAGDAGGQGECDDEGNPNVCPEGEICYAGTCEPLCGFGGNGSISPITGQNGFLECPGDLVCTPALAQDANRFGACVSLSRFDDLQTNPTCPEEDSRADEDESPQDDYCEQLMRKSDFTCQGGRCDVPCSRDTDCRDSDSYCEYDEDDNGFCTPILCGGAGSDVASRDAYCADLFNRVGVGHPSEDASATFTAEDAYCLNNACFVRVDGEAETTCADASVCGGEEVCVSQNYCMLGCSSDSDCADFGLYCAYTLPADERLDTIEVSPFVCVDYAGLNAAQLADPIRFCEDPDERMGNTGTASWDRVSGDCAYESAPDANSVWYVLIQDDTPACTAEGADGDLPGVEDPGADIAFVGLSDTLENTPSLSDAFGSVYAEGIVVKTSDNTAGRDNDYPGYGHLAPLFRDDDEPEMRYSSTTGCPVDPPAPNNTFSLDCGGWAILEFRSNVGRDGLDIGDRANLNNEGFNKFVVVSEYNSTCESFGADATPENYTVSFCPTGVSLANANPASCMNPMNNIALGTPMAEGPAIFSFGP